MVTFLGVLGVILSVSGLILDNDYLKGVSHGVAISAIVLFFWG